MELTTRIELGLSEKFGSKSFFHKFFYARARDEIAERIRRLREFRTLKQSDLAKLTGMKQSAVSRIEQADYAGWNFKTLARIAEALDARLVVEFKTREEVIKEYAYKRAKRQGMSVLDALEVRDLQPDNGIREGIASDEIATNTGWTSRVALGSQPSSRASAAG